MGCHDHVRARVNTRLEGNEITVFDLLEVKIRTGQMCVAVLSHIAVARKMLESRRYIGGIKSFDKGCDIVSRDLRVVGEGAHTYDRVGRIAVDI